MPLVALCQILPQRIILSIDGSASTIECARFFAYTLRCFASLICTQSLQRGAKHAKLLIIAFGVQMRQGTQHSLQKGYPIARLYTRLFFLQCVSPNLIWFITHGFCNHGLRKGKATSKRITKTVMSKRRPTPASTAN